MADDRKVWIVGDVETGAKAGDQRYHLSSCFVLDQVSNHGRSQKVLLADLPESFDPCQICTPGRRRTPSTEDGTSSSAVEAAAGVQPGQEVTVENADTNGTKVFRIAVSAQERGEGEISPDGKLASVLIGQAKDVVVEVDTPKGGLQRWRIVGFGSPADGQA